MPTVGFVGLGVMGGPMAGHIHRNGLDLVVWNRSAEKRAPFVELGVPVANSLRDLAAQCDVICLCVSKTEDVKACLDELVTGAKPGTLFVDHSTILPEAAKDFHDQLKRQGFRFVDAPITGGSMGAKNGTLTIFCGGEASDIEDAMPVMKCYAKTAERVGGPGAGQMMKMVNQIAVGGALMALCESWSFAEKAGLDLDQTKRLVGSGAAGSWAFENYGPKILNRDWSPGFSIDNQVKDFVYCEQTGKAIDADIPGTALVRQLLQEMQAEGRGAETTAALFEKLLERHAP